MDDGSKFAALWAAVTLAELCFQSGRLFHDRAKQMLGQAEYDPISGLALVEFLIIKEFSYRDQIFTNQTSLGDRKLHQPGRGANYRYSIALGQSNLNSLLPAQAPAIE